MPGNKHEKKFHSRCNWVSGLCLYFIQISALQRLDFGNSIDAPIKSNLPRLSTQDHRGIPSYRSLVGKPIIKLLWKKKETIFLSFFPIHGSSLLPRHYYSNLLFNINSSRGTPTNDLFSDQHALNRNTDYHRIYPSAIYLWTCRLGETQDSDRCQIFSNC